VKVQEENKCSIIALEAMLTKLDMEEPVDSGEINLEFSPTKLKECMVDNTEDRLRRSLEIE
jgi:hypothetical protein